MCITKKMQKAVLEGDVKTIDKVLIITEPKIESMTRKAIKKNKMDRNYEALFNALLKIELERALYEDFPRFVEKNQ